MTGRAEAPEAVYEAYGRLMNLVQYWERAQTILWIGVQFHKPKKSSGDFDTRLSQKAIRQLEAAYLATPAQAVQVDIGPLLDDRTREAMPDLLRERNGLAHRFLLEHGQDDGFRPGTIDLTVALGRRFFDSQKALLRAIDAQPFYDGPVLGHWPDLAGRIVERVSRGDRNPRDPAAQ